MRRVLVHLPCHVGPHRTSASGLSRSLFSISRTSTGRIPAHQWNWRRKASTDANISHDTGATAVDRSLKVEPSPEPDSQSAEEDYHGPLTTTFRRLKILSLSSLTLTFALTPLIFVLETSSSVPFLGRAALAGIAIATSSVSTALVAWCGKPYVVHLNRLPPDNAGLLTGRGVAMTTLTLGLKKRLTTVYDPAFLVPASRPFATWELAEGFKMAPTEVTAAQAQGVIPGEETVAETRTRDGEVIGRWIVRWDEQGNGTCHEVGKVVR